MADSQITTPYTAVPKPKRSNFRDIAGQRFNYLVALDYAGNGHWFCQCVCGKIRKVRGQYVRYGQIISCGCKSNQRIDGGLSSRESTTYQTWTRIMQRCRNPRAADFPDYGGRGIVVCERWYVFANFLADMGRRPSPTHSIERKDVNGNYNPDNCKWGTPLEQGRNKRNNRLVTLNNETRTASEWQEILNLPHNRTSMRHHYGWCDTCVYTLPSRKSCPHRKPIAI